MEIRQTRNPNSERDPRALRSSRAGTICRLKTESNRTDVRSLHSGGAAIRSRTRRKRATRRRSRRCSHIAPYPAANLPVEHDEFRVDGSRHPEPGCIDQATQVGGQLAENSRRRHWALPVVLLSLVCVTHRPARCTTTRRIVRRRAFCDRCGTRRRSGGNEPVVCGKPDSIRTVHCSRKSDTARRGGMAGNSENLVPLLRRFTLLRTPGRESTAVLAPRSRCLVKEGYREGPPGDPRLRSAVIISFGRVRVSGGPGDAFWVNNPKNEHREGGRLPRDERRRGCYQTCYHFLEKAAQTRMNQGPSGWVMSLK